MDKCARDEGSCHAATLGRLPPARNDDTPTIIVAALVAARRSSERRAALGSGTHCHISDEGAAHGNSADGEDGAVPALATMAA